MPLSRPLHPNLARLAARYDDIYARFARGSIGPEAARSEIAALVARDDEGTQWSLDPDSGRWLRRTISGGLVPDEPPTYGLATPTPHDVSRGSGFNPDSQVDHHAVEDELLYAPNQYSGATRALRPIPEPYVPWWRRLLGRR